MVKPGLEAGRLSIMVRTCGQEGLGGEAEVSARETDRKSVV